MTRSPPMPVSPEKARALQLKLESLGIREEDLDESFVRSGGKGGQNVNKVATCVVLLHRPTGIRVKCQAERSQGLNRYRARQMLAGKIAAELLGKQSEQQQSLERIRRQKRRRSRRAKRRMLEEKHARAATKVQRKPVSSDE